MNDELSIENITQKEVTTLSDEEKAYLNENKSQLNEEQLEKFSSVLTDTENSENTEEKKDTENGDQTNE